MPAVSQAQRGYLASKFGPGWMQEHHFDNKGTLPDHVGDGKSKEKKSQEKPKRKNPLLEAMGQ